MARLDPFAPSDPFGWIAAGLALAVIGIVVTGAFSLPLNDDLAAAGGPARIGDLTTVKDDYVGPWVASPLSTWARGLGGLGIRRRCAIKCGGSRPDSVRAVKWKPGKPGKNVEDRRGESGGGGGMFPGGGGSMGGGTGFPLPTGKGGGGIATLIIGIVLFFVIRSCGGGGDGGGGFGDILGDILTGGGGSAINLPADGTSTDAAPEGGDPNDKTFQFTTFVFNDVQGFWGPTLTQAGKQYQDATLVVFTDQVNSGCGAASAATGPFYCPLDSKAYIDLSFFRELEQRFDAPGDFAQAYVIAHEVGHHVQNQLGIEQKVREESQARPDDANELSVRLELQADCFAGVWGRSTYDRGVLEEGDLEEGMNAAGAVGDDRIAEKTGAHPDPHTYTHGTAEQRARWLKTGFDAGNLDACDTFSGDI